MQKLLLALAFGTLLSELRLGAEGRNPPYGVKLCGREFIRAVIFTCGGSRWRRAGDLDILSGPPAGEDSSETTPPASGDASRLPGMLPHQDLSPDYHERWRGKPGRGLAEESWPLERTVRDVVAGLSTSCCQVGGCTQKRDLSLPVLEAGGWGNGG
ncbi:LOW QUALITY PROTEIN: relaxin-3 [Mauremys mutica]|uniref:LOW QUALITY PROTEIN: relaxin-3 n=1 Tax=Mauremys mutica TaxID=74926 RepID=UPI001D1692FE|nr:LOW QUALITY PROTEIN: relaxin-3 [Mauremys mutica]